MELETAKAANARYHKTHALNYCRAYEATHGIPPADDPHMISTTGVRYTDRAEQMYYRYKRYLLRHQEHGQEGKQLLTTVVIANNPKGGATE